MSKSIAAPRRYPSGQIIEQDTTPRMTEEERWGVALFQREKLGATPDNFKDQLWSGPLNMMRQWAVDARCDGEGISRIQYDALSRFAKLRGRYLRATDAPRDSTVSPAMTMVSAGSIRGGVVIDEDQDVKDEREYNGARSALLSYGAAGIEWLNTAEALARDDKAGHEHQDEWRGRLGAVRCAANVLARYFGMM